MAADVAISLINEYPVKLLIPPLGFEILVPNCLPNDPYILLANAITSTIDIEPKSDVEIGVQGLVRDLPDILTATCPNSHSSPLDTILGDYLHGERTTVFVRGAKSPSPDTPEWISSLISSVTVPLPFPGHTFDNLIKNFSLADVHFSLPDPMASPGEPAANPRLSAVIEALVALPKEMNFPVNVSRVRANADVYYKGSKLGELDLKKWQKGNSTRIDAHGDEGASLLVRSVVKQAPLNITDDDVFTEVVSTLIFGRNAVMLDIDAEVDVEVKTVLGKFIIRNIPAQGKVPIKRPSSLFSNA